MDKKIAEEIVDRFRVGEKVFDLSKEYNLSRMTIYRLLKARNINTNGRGKLASDTDTIRDCYLSGKSIEKIANDFSVSTNAVRSLLLRVNVKLRNPQAYVVSRKYSL